MTDRTRSAMYGLLLMGAAVVFGCQIPPSKDRPTSNERDTAPSRNNGTDDRDSAPSRNSGSAPRDTESDGQDYKNYLFCTWNVENFFDDQDDPKNHDDMEDWYGRNPKMFQLKVEHLAKALLMMNDGKGPDILCMCEVESTRSVEALRQALNVRLDANGQSHLVYDHILFKDDITGRRFAPAILTRLPVIADKTKKLGNGGYRRILEGHIDVNGHELIVIAAHWTSRVRADTDSHRIEYANACYGRLRAIMTADANADVIVCGDFNDEFKDESVQKGLHASNDPQAVVRSRSSDALLYDISARFDGTGPVKGTIYGRGKWATFDHICVSRGLLDGRGWVCDPRTAQIFAPKELRKAGSKGEPLPFGKSTTEGERGYSDHFPVTVRVRVQNFQ